MIDHDDVDEASWLPFLGNSFWWLMFCVVFIAVLWMVARDNKENCMKMECPVGMTPALQNHDCQCVTKAVPVQ